MSTPGDLVHGHFIGQAFHDSSNCSSHLKGLSEMLQHLLTTPAKSLGGPDRFLRQRPLKSLSLKSRIAAGQLDVNRH